MEEGGAGTRGMVGERGPHDSNEDDDGGTVGHRCDPGGDDGGGGEWREHLLQRPPQRPCSWAAAAASLLFSSWGRLFPSLHYLLELNFFLYQRQGVFSSIRCFGELPETMVLARRSYFRFDVPLGSPKGLSGWSRLASRVHRSNLAGSGPEL